jgi:hypothetical protein
MESPLEKILMTAYKEQMISFIRAHPYHIEEAIQLAVAEKQPYSWRAAWLICSILDGNESKIEPWIPELINAIPGKKDGHQRELIKTLLKFDLDEDSEGIVFNHCMDLWEKVGKEPSVRHMALRFILKTVRKYPELLSELEFITQEHYLESLSPGIKRSAIKMIRELKKENLKSSSPDL